MTTTTHRATTPDSTRATSPAGTTPTLVLDDVTLTFPDGTDRVTACDHVSLTLTDGELVALTGPSGSGKSSLLAVAATLIRPDSGHVRLRDRELTTLSDRELGRVRREDIGIVFQQPNLVSSLTAVEQLTAMDHLAHPLEALTPAGRRRRRATRDRAEHLLDRMGLAAARDRRVGALSGGQRQRVNLARALMTDPALLLVDEPTSALDSTATATVMDLICDVVREEHVATLLVTHDRDAADRADREVTMVDGVLDTTGRAALVG
ncbi:ATP-binding cassette domain-containing protein [Corynebacterium bovis]|uniref:ABC transporter ATP-binding protein n=1 Tax=Corynebacterium bovis TaxID=36808 RepID=UPI0031391F9D